MARNLGALVEATFAVPGLMQRHRDQALRQCLTRYQADPNAAKQAISVGESKPEGKFEPTELAAYTLIANLILNLDETVTRN